MEVTEARLYRLADLHRKDAYDMWDGRFAPCEILIFLNTFTILREKKSELLNTVNYFGRCL